MTVERCIVAMGGGGFSMEPDNPLLDKYVLSLAGRERPRICFVPTASGDSDAYIVKFYAAFGHDRCRPSHLSLFHRSVSDLQEFVEQQDIVYVGGGNTANMLAVWREHGFDSILRAAWDRGAILCGVSAGAVSWFESGVTDSYGKPLQAINQCLGLLPGSHCPHYDGEADRRPAYHRLVAGGYLPPGMAADDGVALRYVGTELAEVVSSRSEARAWHVALSNGQPEEVEVPSRFLGTIV